MSFQVGDVCVGVNFRVDVHHNGVECVVTVPLQNTKYGLCYGVRWADEDKDRWAYPHTLRLKRPPPDEFQPAEPEFVSDLLKRLGRVSA